MELNGFDICWHWLSGADGRLESHVVGGDWVHFFFGDETTDGGVAGGPRSSTRSKFPPLQLISLINNLNIRFKWVYETRSLF